MKTLGDFLQRLTQARVLAEVPYVVIRPVTDHSVPTLETRELFSLYPTVRALAATELAAEAPLLQSLVFPVETMSHLPSAVSGRTDTLSRQIRFTLVNGPYRGFASLFDYLVRDAPLDRAELLLRLLVVPPRELGTHPQHQNRVDVEESLGDDFDVFAGQVDRVVSVGDVIECVGKTILPEVPWKLVPDDGSDPRDRGLRLPFPLGQDAIVRCVNLDIGAVSHLVERLNIEGNQIQVDDGDAFPSSGNAMIGAEAVSWATKSGNFLTGVVRGILSSSPSDHIIGSPIIELDDVVLGVSHEAASGVTGLFIRSQAGAGQVVEISDLLYSV
ncbi:MAG: hypothetical protein V3S94_08965, partial [Gammaproteobacteria bacterium]